MARSQQTQYPYQTPPGKKRHWVRNSFLAFCGFIALIIIIAVASSSGGNTGSTPAASGGSSTSPSSSAQPDGSSLAKAGTAVRDGKFQFKVTSASQAKSVGDTADGFGDTAQGEYTVLHVTVTNIGQQPQTLDDSSQYVYDSAGRKYDASSTADIDINGNDQVFFNDINPGNTVNGELAFDMPTGTKSAKAEFHDSAFSGGTQVALP